MLKQTKNIRLAIISFALMLPLFTNYHHIEVEAAAPMPTAINTANLDDAAVNAYYDGVSGKSGDELLGTLYDIIKGHNEYDYDSTTHRTIYKIIDRNWELSPLSEAAIANFDYVNDNPFIKKLYADYNGSAETADRFKNDGASRVSFDKEHIWAQSLGNFGRDGGAGSDFFALWPSDVKGNQNAHSNYNFAVPTSSITTYVNDYGTYVGRNGNIVGSVQKVFEPLDEYKGDIARAMFYMPARYYVYVDTLHPKLTLVAGSPSALTATPEQPGLAGDLATLLAWHELDPVDEYEIHRNNLIYNNYQGNRNPFIDHPEWAEIAYDTDYAGAGASNIPGSSSVGTGVISSSSASSEEVSSSSESSSTTSQAEEDAFLRLDVALIDEAQPRYLFDKLTSTDFTVRAEYENLHYEAITSFTIEGAEDGVLTLNTLGRLTVAITAFVNEVIRSGTVAIDVQLSTPQIIIASATVAVTLTIVILLPPVRRALFRGAKRTIKSSVKRTRKK